MIVISVNGFFGIDTTSPVNVRVTAAELLLVPAVTTSSIRPVALFTANSASPISCLVISSLVASVSAFATPAPVRLAAAIRTKDTVMAMKLLIRTRRPRTFCGVFGVCGVGTPTPGGGAGPGRHEHHHVLHFHLEHETVAFPALPLQCCPQAN